MRESQRVYVAGALDVTQTYLYDKVNRLETAEEQAGPTSHWKQVYAYDRFGNRTLGAGTTYPSQLDAANNPQVSPANNRITSAGYSYDEAGNLLCDPVRPCAQSPLAAYYSYDAESKMKAAAGGFDGGGTTYSYDGDGRRVKKATYNGEVTVFVYDAAGRVVAEYSNQVQYNGTSYLTQDTLGSTRVVTGQDRSVRSRHDYFPFGEEIGANVGGRTTQQGYVGDTVRQKFTGKERDLETGLDFFAARYYSSSQGRFTSVDPSNKSIDPSDPQTWNRYTYTLNNPLRYIDKNGKWPTETHQEFISQAFYGLNASEIHAIQRGSNLVDTYFGTGRKLDIPITLIMEEAPKHAMTPEGMSTEDAYNASMEFVADMAAEARTHQTFGLSIDGAMSSQALIAFGKGAHMYMDSTSPEHAGWQVYSMPRGKVNIGGIEIYYNNKIQFIKEGVEHKEGESRAPTDEERKQTLTLLRAYYLTTFGDGAFRRAVPDSDQRQAAYDYLKQHGIQWRGQ